MKKNIPIHEIMTTEIATAHLGQKISDVRKMMSENNYHHVPIVSGNKLLGMLSASDILGLTVGGLEGDQRSMDAYMDHQFTIESVMTSDLASLEKDATVSDAAELLATGDYHAVPVVVAENLVGLVTSTDLIRFLRDQF